MKLGDIEISVDAITILLCALWFYLGVSILMVILTIIKVIALYFFDYTITLFGIPL